LTKKRTEESVDLIFVKVASASSSHGYYWGILCWKESMPEPMNLLRYFIVDEIGTSQLLATILDPYPEPAIRRAQSIVWEKFSEYLRDRGVEIRETSPTFVQRGIYLDRREIDLLLGWDRWLVAIENKIRRRTIEEGQLQEQYDLLRHSVVSNRWGSHGLGPQSSICLVFLVPRQGVGKKEYEKLTVRQDQGDTKVYLTWKNLLGWLSEVDWPEDSALQATFAGIVAHGLQLTQRLLRTRKVRRSTSPPEYATFLAAVAERVDRAVEAEYPWEGSSQQLVKTLYYNYFDERVGYICEVSKTEIYIKLQIGTGTRHLEYREKAKQALHQRFDTVQPRLGKVDTFWGLSSPRTVSQRIPTPRGLRELKEDSFIEMVANRLTQYVATIQPVIEQIHEEMGLTSEYQCGSTHPVRRGPTAEKGEHMKDVVTKEMVREKAKELGLAGEVTRILTLAEVLGLPAVEDTASSVSFKVRVGGEEKPVFRVDPDYEDKGRLAILFPFYTWRDFENQLLEELRTELLEELAPDRVDQGTAEWDVRLGVTKANADELIAAICAIHSQVRREIQRKIR